MCKSNIYGRKWLRDKYNPLGLPWKEQWSAFFPFHWKGCFFMHHILLAINQISLSEIWKCVKFV